MNSFAFLRDFPFGWLWLFLFGVILFRAGGTYALGRLIARGATRSPRIRRMTSSARFARAKRLIDDYGVTVVVLGFLLIGVQTVIHLAAGTTRMRLGHYLPGLVIGGAVWALIYSTVGFVGFTAVSAAYREHPVLTVLVAAGVLLGVLASIVVNRHLGRKRTAAEAADGHRIPADLPGGAAE